MDKRKTKSKGGHSTRDSFLASHPMVRGSNLGFIFLSAANGQRPRNYLSCCSCCCCCGCSSCCSPFGLIPHLNELKKIWLKLDSIICPLTHQSITLPTELQIPWHLDVKNISLNLAADLGPVLVDLLVSQEIHHWPLMVLQKRSFWFYPKKYFFFTRKFFPMSMMSSFTVRCFLYPLTLVRTRLQVQQRNAHYSGTLDAFRKIVRWATTYKLPEPWAVVAAYCSRLLSTIQAVAGPSKCVD